MVSTLELRTRDINGAPNVPGLGTPQHAYFILTNAQGEQFLLRGGPKNGDMLKDNLAVDFVRYDATIQGVAKTDYITDPNQYRSTILYKGDDHKAYTLMNKMWEYGRKVNDGAYDYKLPVCDIINFGIYNKCSQQNSNAFTYQAMQYAGIKPKLPIMADGKPTWVPGFKSEIRDTLLDHLIEYGGQLKAINISMAQDIYNRYISESKTFVDKAINTYNAVKATLPYTMKSPEILAAVDNYYKWENQAATNLQNEMDNLKARYEEIANSECSARLGMPSYTQVPCTPGGPNSVLINTYINSWGGLNIPGSLAPTIKHIETKRIWKCDIKIPCDDIAAHYQTYLNQVYAEKINVFNHQKQFMEQETYKLIEGVVNQINQMELNDRVQQEFDNVYTVLMGELNGVKNNLLNLYGIEHEIFA